MASVNGSAGRLEGEESKQCQGNTSTTARCLVVLVIALTWIVVVLGSLAVFSAAKDACESPECVKQSAWIQSLLSRDAKPCQDFYKYTCPAKNRKYGLDRLKVVVERQVELLIKEAPSQNDPLLERVFKRMLDACLDRGNVTSFTILSDVWPWTIGNDDWLDYLYLAREHGLGYDVFVDVSVVKNENGEPILRVGPPNTVIDTIGDRTNFLKTLSDITNRGLETDSSELITLKELDKRYHFVAKILLSNTSVEDFENETVQLVAPVYFSDLADLINVTEKRLIAAYVRGQVAKYFLREYDNWMKASRPEDYCLDKIKRLLPHPLESAYARRYNNPKINQEVKTIAEDIKNELIATLDKAKWLNDKTRHFILGKIGDIQFHIGANEALLEAEFESEQTAKTILSKHNFLDMILLANKLKHNHKYPLQKKPYKNCDLCEATLTIQPFYSFKHKAIVLPAAILQNPIFHLGRPKYLNYGLLGAIIGREMMRAVLDFVKDSDEECEDVDWSWMRRQFECFDKQYVAYNYTDVSSNRNIRRADTVANVAGTYLAFSAYLKRTNLEGSDLKLPSWNLNGNQMFWLAKALQGCHFLQTFSINNAAPSYMVLSPFINLHEFTHPLEKSAKREATKLERALVIVVAILAACAVAIAWYVFKGSPATCYTSECVKRAAWLLSTVEPEADPCDNFHAFVCKSPDWSGEILKTNRKQASPELIRNISAEGSKVPIAGKLKEFYETCLYSEGSEKQMDRLVELLKGWGFGYVSEGDFDWRLFLYKARRRGLKHDIFFEFNVVRNGSGNFILRIEPPRLSSSISLEMFNVTVDEDTASFESTLHQLITQSDASVIDITVDELDYKYLFASREIIWHIAGWNCTDYDTVQLKDPMYFQNLTKLLLNTTSSVLIDYLTKEVLRSLWEHTWSKNSESRSDFCVSKTIHMVPFAEDLVLYQKESRDVLAMAENIKSQLLNVFKKPVKNIEILTPHQLCDDFRLQSGSFKSYVESDTKGNLWHLVADAKKFEDDCKYYMLHQRGDDLACLIYNSEGVSLQNLTIGISPALLKLNYYTDGPRHINYGSIGSIIGRKLVRNLLTSLKPKRSIKKELKCLFEQQRDYYFYKPGEKVKETEEVFLDLAGTTLAYQAYSSFFSWSDVETSLPGLRNYTTRQQFWMAKFRFDCDYAEDFSVTSVLPFINIGNWSADFQCFAGRYMNPLSVPRCKVF